jgi:hypothetical protein
MIRFCMSLPWAFFAKSSQRYKNENFPCFSGFPSTGRVGECVPWFGDERSLASRKSSEFSSRDAKTPWDELAGLERCGHVEVTKSMEAVSWTRNGAKIACANSQKLKLSHRSARARAPKFPCQLISANKSCFRGSAGTNPSSELFCMSAMHSTMGTKIR